MLQQSAIISNLVAKCEQLVGSTDAQQIFECEVNLYENKSLLKSEQVLQWRISLIPYTYQQNCYRTTVCDNERFVSFVSILVNISKRIYWKCLYIRCMQTNSKKAFNVYTGTAQNHVPIFTLLLMQFSVFTQTPPTV